MRPKKQSTVPQIDLFRSRLENMLARQHALYRLGNLIAWKQFENRLGKLYAEEGRPGITPALAARPDKAEYLSFFSLAEFTGMVAAIESECWPFSRRNGERIQPE